MPNFLSGYEVDFAIKLALCLVLGLVIGVERELRNKPAGISTHCFVMAGACLFTFISIVADPNSPARIAAQVVSGVGFLGAGMILKSDNNSVRKSHDGGRSLVCCRGRDGHRHRLVRDRRDRFGVRGDRSPHTARQEMGEQPARRVKGFQHPTTGHAHQ
jgi:hypothetical protein